MAAPDQVLRYRSVVLLVLQPTLSMIFSNGTPLSYRSRRCQSLAKVNKATATRDLAELVEKAV